MQITICNEFCKAQNYVQNFKTSYQALCNSFCTAQNSVVPAVTIVTEFHRYIQYMPYFIIMK
jgi:hypothetical protein